MALPRRGGAGTLWMLALLLLPCVVRGLATALVKGRCELMVTALDGKVDGDKFTYSSSTRGKKLSDEKAEATFLQDVEQTKKDEFVGKIIRKEEYSDILLNAGKSIVFFIHGFNVQSGGTLGSTLEMQQMFDTVQQRPEHKLKKPTLVVPVDWPCGNRFGILRDYWSDRQAAKTAARIIAPIFEEMPSELRALRRKTSLNVVAHSMGNRVLRTVGKSLAPPEDWDERVVSDPDVSIMSAAPESLSGWKNLFDNVFLVAADVPANVMDEPRSVDQKLAAIESGVASLSVLAQKMHVLHAGDDIAMVGSTAQRVILFPFGRWNRPVRRLGRSGPRMPYWEKLDAELDEALVRIDCTKWEDRPARSHGYQAIEKAVEHYLAHMP